MSSLLRWAEYLLILAMPLIVSGAMAQDDTLPLAAEALPASARDIEFSSSLPSSVTAPLNIPMGGADVAISARDCCIRDDIVELYVDDCLVAQIVSDDPAAAFGSHAGETHTVSLTAGEHTVEYRNVFSREGPSGWIVEEALQPFTNQTAPCSIKSIDFICRPLQVDPNDPLRLNAKVGRHCYFLVTSTSGMRSTYGAYSVDDQLTPAKDALSDLNNASPCGSGTFNSVCRGLTAPSGQTLEGMVAVLETAVAAGPQGPYQRVTNNSNLWAMMRLQELGVSTSLPIAAIKSRLTAAAQLPIAIAELVGCSVDVYVIQRIKCAVFDVCN
jgi:hypothetical protein